MKVALVHDYLSQDGGAERVLLTLSEMYPSAPIYVLFHDKKKLEQFRDKEIHESFLRFLPLGRTRYQWYLPLMPLATERHDLHDYDLIISSTSAFAKGVITRPDALHISYCHTPTRYLWTDTHKYLADLKYNRVIKAALPRLIHKLRLWDKASTDRVDHFIANSQTVRRRINKYYRRESDIVYPPIDTDKFYISEALGNYFVTGGRLVPYKRFDLVVHVFNRLGWKLKIFGDGPELERLKKYAKSNIEFLGRVDEARKAKLLSEARAFIHPQLEDFGITPIESMASGRPVIAYGAGGATETVIPDQTGVLFYEQTWEALLDVVLNFDDAMWDSQAIRAWAERYDTRVFKKNVADYVAGRYEEFQQGLNQCELDISYKS